MEAADFVRAEPLMLADTDGDLESRAEFYERWADAIRSAEEATQKYRESHRYWAAFASEASSGGEGTARIAEANRVLMKLDALRSKI